MSVELSLRHKAYRHIQGKLLTGELTAGQIISEASVAGELGVSRTPVREAILQFEQEGIVEQVPRFGTVVRQLGRSDLVELYELRELLEPHAAARSAEGLVPENAARLESLVSELDGLSEDIRRTEQAAADESQMRRFLSADIAFHLLLLQAAGNRRLTDIITKTRLLGHIFGTRRQVHDRAVIAETSRQHRRILNAVLSKDADGARQEMRDHIRTSCRLALDYFDNRPPLQPADMLSDDVLAAIDRIELRHRGPDNLRDSNAREGV